MPIRGSAPVIRVPGGGGGGTRTFAVLQLSTTNSGSPLAAGTHTVPWDTVQYDNGGYTGSVANGFVVPSSGDYLVGAHLNFTYNGVPGAGWIYYGGLILSGTTPICGTRNGEWATAPGPANLWEASLGLSAPVALTAGAQLTAAVVMEYTGWIVGVDTNIDTYFYIGSF